MATAKEIVDYVVENCKDIESILPFYSDDAVIAGPGVEVRGKEGAGQYFSVFSKAFPDYEITTHHEYVAGSTIVHEATFSGTHTGNLSSPDGDTIPPTGRRVNLRYAEVFVVQGEQIISDHLYFDQVELLTQLGLMPAPAASTGR